MSKEAWGDEGNVATHWEETLILTELDEVIKRFENWVGDNGPQMPSLEFVDGVFRVRDELIALQDMLSGKID